MSKYLKRSMDPHRACISSGLLEHRVLPWYLLESCIPIVESSSCAGPRRAIGDLPVESRELYRYRYSYSYYPDLTSRQPGALSLSLSLVLYYYWFCCSKTGLLSSQGGSRNKENLLFSAVASAMSSHSQPEHHGPTCTCTCIIIGSYLQDSYNMCQAGRACASTVLIGLSR